MTDMRAAAQQALEALEDMLGWQSLAPQTIQESAKGRAAALKAALAEPVQEPPCATRECMPSECPNCASLEAQNTELDRKLVDLEQTSLELCEVCGWRTLIPGDCCLNCERQKPVQEPVALDWLHKWANQDDGEPETQWHEGYEAARRVVQIHLTTPPQRKPEPVQEPVAWRFQSAVGGWAYGSQPPLGSKYPAYPLYTAPPQRLPLTEEEIQQCFKEAGITIKGHHWTNAVRNVERAHGIGGSDVL